MVSNRLKILVSVFASAIVVLSIAHHTANFWGLGILNECLIFFMAVPILASLIFLFLNRIWDIAAFIEKKRWLLFIFPALAVSATFAWHFHQAPSVWHQLVIAPSPIDATGQIELTEIKYPPGRVIRFSKMPPVKGWEVEGDTIKTNHANPSPLEYTFFSVVGEPTNLLFRGSPESRDVIITLDGKNLEVNLRRANESQIPVEMITAYKMGIPAVIILVIVTIADFLVALLFLLFIWLIQEIYQISPIEERKVQDDTFPSHRISLIILLVLALTFHLLNFLAVPLIIGPDSPSFLSGAFHWIQYHNLDGVPAARGPAMAILLIPPLLIFGRNAWGVKATLHLVAIACVPTGYAIGWELFRRRSLAFFAGLAFVLMPELYLLANIVMSDVPNVLIVLVFCALFIPALRTFSKRSVIASVLATSLATLHRPENIVLMILAAGFLAFKIVLEKKEIRARSQLVGISLLLAAIPLLAWSAHNQRVHGFFGLSNYAGAIWYDGWIYYGEASNVHITDPDSPSVQVIAKAVKAYNKPIEYAVVPTSLELYPALLAYGYTDQQAMKIFNDAAKDSILHDPRFTLDLYILKLKKSFEPEFNTVVATTFLPTHEFKNDYFDIERPVLPAVVEWQKTAYDLLQWANTIIYRPLVLLSLAVMFLAIYQKDFFKWAPLVVVTMSRLFVTITIGLGNWRYVVSGVALLFFFTLLAIQIVRGFLAVFINPDVGRRG
jgi:4-amino-4-deoxy-L-arabinose transferase-like glycosyltransferase